MRVRKSLRPGHTVKVMPNGIDAGIVCKPLFSENIKRPEAGFCNRPARGTITGNCSPGCVFNRVFCLPRVLTELIRCNTVDRPMPVAMAGQFVSVGLYFAHQVRKSGSHPADKEKCCFSVVLSKKIQHPLRVGYNARRPTIPAFTLH